jgi:hypothetical protein
MSLAALEVSSLPWPLAAVLAQRSLLWIAFSFPVLKRSLQAPTNWLLSTLSCNHLTIVFQHLLDALLESRLPCQHEPGMVWRDNSVPLATHEKGRKPAGGDADDSPMPPVGCYSIPGRVLEGRSCHQGAAPYDTVGVQCHPDDGPDLIPELV